MNINYPMIESYFYRARYGVGLINPLGILGIGVYSYYMGKKSEKGDKGDKGDLTTDLLEKRGRCDHELTAYGKCLETTGYCYLACERELEAYKRCLQNHPTKE